MNKEILDIREKKEQKNKIIDKKKIVNKTNNIKIEKNNKNIID